MAKTKVTGGYIADSAITSDHLHTTLDLSTKTLTIGATTVSGHLIPDTNITYDLGSSTYRFRDIYLDGTTINLGGTELKKNSDGDIEFKSGSNFKKLVISELEFDDGTNRKKFKIDSGRIKSFDSSGVSDTADKISLSSNTTDDLGEGDNLYFTTARARGAISASTGIAITDGAISAAAVPNASLTNSSVTINSNSLSLGGTLTLDTDDIGEGSTNLYYTTARWDTKMAAADTDDLSEGSTNLYFTNARARGAISVSGNALSYSSSTGVLTANYEESPSFTGNVTTTGHYIADTHFRSSDSNATLSATGGGGVYLRPNGYNSTTAQFIVEATTGNVTVAGTISSGAITSTGAIQGASFSDGTISGITFIDEDSFSTNSATRVPTQQSIKAYVDAQVAGVVDTAPAALNTLNELAAALGDDASFSTTTSTALGNRLRVDTAAQGLTGTQQANAITNLGITATKAELNLLDGVTATTTELNYTDGVTSNIQIQLNGKLSTSGTAVQATNLNATDDRDIAPEDLNYSDDLRIYFADKGGLETGTIGSNYQDVLVLNSYIDATGGDANALAFDKSEKKIYHYQADQAATNWGTAKTLAYTDDITLSTLGITATATELNYTDGVTSNIQTQLNTKLPLSGGTMTGALAITAGGNALTINGTAPTILFNDTSGEDDFYIHINSNRFYVLADRDGSGDYETPHPLELNASNNIGYAFGHRLFTEDYHPNADTWTTARTITLGGDLTGNVSIDGSANVTLTAAVVDDSHNHNHSDGNFTVNGLLQAGAGSNHISTASAPFRWQRSSSGQTGQDDNVSVYVDDSNIYFTHNNDADGDASGFNFRYTTGGTATNLLNFSASTMTYKGQTVFHTGYHPNADTLTTARTIGGVSFNGSANINLPGVNTSGNQNTSGTAAGLSGTPDITVGTISSGRVTTSEDLRMTGNAYVRSDNIFAFLTINGNAQVGKFKAVAAQTSYANSASTGMFNALNGYAVGTGNGTTVIDSSRNLTNIGTISSGAITSSGILSLGSYFKAGTSVAQGFYQDASNGAYRANGTTSTRGFYFQSPSGASTTMYVGLVGTYASRVGVGTTSPAEQFHATGTARVGSLKVGTATVFDTSRNMANLGNITGSGILDITTVHIRGDNSTGYSEDSLVGGLSLWGAGASTSQIMFKPTSSGSLGNHGFCTDTYNTYFVMDTTNRGWVFRNATTNTNVASISNTGGASFNNGIKINATTIIDSSRNITAGTISGGAITSSGVLTLSVDTTDALNFSANSTNDARGISFNGRTALSADYSDGWLRINNQSEFGNGIFTPGNLRVDGDMTMASRLFHEGDTNTYLQFHAADQFRVVTGGVERLEVNNSRVTVAGALALTDSNTELTQSGVQLRVQTPSGYCEIGPNNTTWCHMETDRGKFYFNTSITVDTGIVSSYDEDLILRRANSTTNEIKILTNRVDIQGELCLSNYAKGTMQNGTLNLGRVDTNYAWSGSTWASDIRVGMLLNCSETYEIAVHDSGDSVDSFMKYNGTDFEMGNDIGWGTTSFTFAGGVKAVSYGAPSGTTALYYGFNGSEMVTGVNGAAYYHGSDGGGYGIVIQGGHPICKSVKIGSVNAGTTVIDSSRNLTNIVNITSSGQFKTNSTTFAPTPNTYAYLSASELQFGGNNNGRQGDSAQISAGQHQPSSLNFVGMSSNTSSSTRRMDFWVENGAYFRGSLVCTGNITAYGSASDKRLKKDIVKIDNAIDKIKSVSGYEFAWNENAPEDKQNKREFGVIAQEVEEAGLDKLVFDYERPVSGTDEDNKDLPDEKWKAVHYDKFVPILIEGMKEQQELIEKLTARIEELENK